MAAIGTILVDEGDGTTIECHRTWKGSEGPFLTPVSEQFEVKTSDDDADGSGTLYDSLPLRTTHQVSVESAPSDDYHVMRKIDALSGVIDTLILGYGGTKYWKLYVDPTTHDLILSATQDNGANYAERNRFQLLSS